MNYYRHFMGDYLRKTMHLTLAEDGAYRRMLDLYYTTEKPLQRNRKKLALQLRANRKEDAKVVARVLREFFTYTDKGYVCKRAEEEIKRDRPRICAASNNGKKGGRPKTQQEPSGFSDYNPVGSSHESSPAPAPAPAIREEKPKTLGRQEPPTEFAVFWAAYPRKVHKPEAQKAFIRVSGADYLEEVLAGLESWKSCEQWKDENFIPHAARFLNQEQWKDRPVAHPKKESRSERFDRNFEEALKRLEPDIRQGN